MWWLRLSHNKAMALNKENGLSLGAQASSPAWLSREADWRSIVF
jgi:hypothetical protein